MLAFIHSKPKVQETKNRKRPRFAMVAVAALLLAVALWMLLTTEEHKRLGELDLARQKGELPLEAQIEWCRLVAKRDSVVPDGCLDAIREYRKAKFKESTAQGLPTSIYSAALGDSIMAARKMYKHITYGKEMKRNGAEAFLKNLELIELAARVEEVLKLVGEATVEDYQNDNKQRNDDVVFVIMSAVSKEGRPYRVTIKMTRTGNRLYDLVEKG